MGSQQYEKEYWNQYVYWYESWLAKSPYKQLVWQRLAPLLAGETSFLDIGAGTGVFSLAAAQIVPNVCCVEFAPNMRQRIHDQAVSQKKHIICLAMDWEQVVPERLDQYDVVLAAHSFYQMRDIYAAFRKMLSVTGKKLMIVTNAKSSPGTYHSIREQLSRLGIVCKQPNKTPHYEKIVSFLTALGVTPTVEIVEYDGGHYYHNLDEAVAHVVLRLGLTQNARQAVGTVLMQYLTAAGNQLHLSEPAEMAVLVCGKE